MLDVQSVDRIHCKRHQSHFMNGAGMAEDTDDADAAVARLEAALERIARLVGQLRAALPAEPSDDTPMSAEAIAARLDTLIGRLRSALGGKPE
jgi:hypothetical protein